MKARPIIFSAPMIRALLDGRKTQTRRIVKPQPKLFTIDRWPVERVSGGVADVMCPYGQPGDLLWARETWAALVPGGNFDEVNGPPSRMSRLEEIRYAATERLAELDADARGYSWRPSIHMPRWASRITLRLTDVRVERLREISEQDAEAEGVIRDDIAGENNVDAYRILWGFIHGHGSWEANPWVWVLEFGVLKQNVVEVKP